MAESNQIHRNKIVVGVDFSETGDTALREAMRLCRQLADSELHAVNVIATNSELHNAKRIDRLSDELRTRIDQLRGHVEQVCAPPKDAEPFTLETILHVRLGDPASALHQVAVDVDADLIVVGTHARRGVAKVILGSVAESLLRTAHLPVLIAHPKDFGGLERSDRQEPQRPGEDLHSTGLSNRLHIHFLPERTRISGLL